MLCSKWCSMQETSEVDFMPECGRRIAAAAIAAGVQVETAVRSILQVMHHSLEKQGNSLLSTS